MAYIGSSPTKVVSRQSANIFTYTATANQTAFTGSDANGNTLACTPSDIMVHMNGLRLEESDYTASTTTVTLGSGAAAGDEVTITAFVTFESADHYNKSTADTRYVNSTGDSMTGNLGINETSPSGSLHVKGTSSTHGKIILEAGGSGGSANNNFVEFNKHDGTKLAEIEVGETVTDGGDIVLKTTPASGSVTERMRVDNAGLVGIGRTPTSSEGSVLQLEGGDGLAIRRPSQTNSFLLRPLSSSDGDGIRFTQGGTGDRMRIDSNGNVFINTLNDMGGILNTSNADGVAIGSANDQGYYRRIYGTAGASLELRFWNGSNEGSLNSSGAWVNASDVSLKENIADIEYGIDTVKSLKPRKYTMKEGGNSEVGFIAQEMESVVPEVVNTSENPNKDEIKGISYGQLTAVLTKALQEAIAKIEVLETKVAALEGG